MTRKRHWLPPGCEEFVDRHGKARRYFRPARGAKRVPLPDGDTRAPEFMEAYHRAKAGDVPAPERRHRGEPGTWDRLLEDYFASPLYLDLSASTQRPYRLVMERWLRDDDLGHRRVRDLKREHIDKMLGKRSSTPGAANDLLKKMRILIGFAIAHGHRTDDPAIGIKRYSAGEGHHTWTDAEISRFRKWWALGTCERTSFELLLNTGQRVSDVVGMTWQAISVDERGIRRISVLPEKTKRKTRKGLRIRLHPDLEQALAAWPKRHVSILTTTFNKPFSTKGLSNFMADAIDKAELPCGSDVPKGQRCVTHGLRKAAARRLAEYGSPAHEIQAITGHASLQEVQRYTAEVDQMRLADAAIERLTGNKGSQTG
jgi:integrase